MSKILFITIGLLMVTISDYTQSMDFNNNDSYGNLQIDKDDVLKYLKANNNKPLKEIARLSTYSYDVLYEVYKETNALTKAVCNTCDQYTVSRFNTWQDFIDTISEELRKEGINILPQDIDESQVENILTVIDKQDYKELKDGLK